MICFKDRMWCSAICDTTWCDRNFTPKQEKLANDWWDGWKTDRPAPVQFRDLHKTCGEYRRPQGHKSPEGVDSRPQHGMVPVQSEVFAEADPKFGGDEKTQNEVGPCSSS